MRHLSCACIAATEKDLCGFDLEPGQVSRVKAIQAEWRKASAGKRQDDPNLGKLMDTYEARIKAELTPDQFRNWRKWCTPQQVNPRASATRTE
ncbi:MAG TPA: hypothetical protein VKG92_07375 [Flavobacteriales bacterium]|nr:hypothetical protein [Flavobacteriales bacterium]